MHEWSPMFHYRDPHSSKNHKYWQKSRLNSVLMLGACFYGRLTLETVLRYGSCKLIKTSSFGCKVLLWDVLNKKWQLRWIEKPKIYSLFDGRLDLLQFSDCKRCCAWRRLWAWILWGNVFRSVREKTIAVVSDQTDR